MTRGPPIYGALNYGKRWDKMGHDGNMSFKKLPNHGILGRSPQFSEKSKMNKLNIKPIRYYNMGVEPNQHEDMKSFKKPMRSLHRACDLRVPLVEHIYFLTFTMNGCTSNFLNIHNEMDIHNEWIYPSSKSIAA